MSSPNILESIIFAIWLFTCFSPVCPKLQTEDTAPRSLWLENKFSTLLSLVTTSVINNINNVDSFHINNQFEAKDVIPYAARNLHRIIIL